MDEHAGAFHMAQKFVTQACAPGRTFDEPGNIGQHHRLKIIQFDDTQVGLQGGEGIISDLGPGTANDGKQSRFAGVGDTDNADVGNQFEFQQQPAFLPFLAALGDAGGLAHTVGEGGVAAAAPTAGQDNRLLVFFGQVGQKLAGGLVAYQSAGRDG